MQTFLPYPNFKQSAQALDNRRLNKQITETYQILRVIFRDKISSGPIQRIKTTGFGWINHPAVALWRGFEPLLYMYWGACIDTWVEERKHNSKFYPLPMLLNAPLLIPDWMGDPDFHRAHQSNLCRKYYEAMAKDSWDYSVEPYPVQFPGVSPDLPYIWPKPIHGPDYVPEGLDQIAKFIGV